jgi:hypothetical protein
LDEMLHGREKLGAVAVPWAEVALARPHQRRTLRLPTWPPPASAEAATAIAAAEPVPVPVPVLVMHIRELSMLSGGLGCALWDGSVVLARWLAANPAVVAHQTVVELGAGCGLPGLVAARAAARVVVTEYIPDLVRNLSYNISINSRDPDEDDDDDDDEGEKEDEAARPCPLPKDGRPRGWPGLCMLHAPVHAAL